MSKSAFSNVCNLKCSYCAPKDSSKWAEEIKQFGPYPTNTKLHRATAEFTPIPERETNPYVDAFWKWWPDLLPSLKVFRVTGGEPLLTKHTMRVLEWIIEHPQPDLVLAVNSNLAVPDAIYSKFLDLVVQIVKGKCVGKFELYTSVDAHGTRADYIRDGLEYSAWLTNVRRYFETVPDHRLIIMSTFNALSITSFKRLYADVIELRRAYPSRLTNDPDGRIGMGIAYLRYPEHQSVMILPPDYADRVDDIISTVKALPEATQSEVDQLTRIRSVMRTAWPDSKLRAKRADFFRFFSEHDRRRGTNFLETFPEMADFWETCRALAEPNLLQSSVQSLWAKAFPASR